MPTFADPPKVRTVLYRRKEQYLFHIVVPRRRYLCLTFPSFRPLELTGRYLHNAQINMRNKY